ncbi:type II toxin-antitoxin system RelE/ParE family toxin [Nitrincola tapanii]|nr:type II toxin-antitoxin system RelE/ParE family toxin [Nitrincola tapanii]
MIEWSPLALERAGEIAGYIALDKPSVAESWLDGLFESVERLELDPMSGRIVPEVNIERIREVIYGAYRVIYRVDTQAQKISVLTVLRGSELIRADELY